MVSRQPWAICMQAFDRAGLMSSVSQMPTVLVPLTTDGQDEIVILRPITTPDFMTARFAELPHNLVRDIAGRDTGSARRRCRGLRYYTQTARDSGMGVRVI